MNQDAGAAAAAPINQREHQWTGAVRPMYARHWLLGAIRSYTRSNSTR